MKKTKALQNKMEVEDVSEEEEPPLAPFAAFLRRFVGLDRLVQFRNENRNNQGDNDDSEEDNDIDYESEVEDNDNSV